MRQMIGKPAGMHLLPGKHLYWLLPILMSMGGILWTQTGLKVGYAVLSAEDGSPLPVASALFSRRNSDGILISEAAVQAVKSTPTGRILVDRSAGKRTALALVNDSDQAGTAFLTLRDSQGLVVAEAFENVGPRQHRAVFVDEIFSGLTPGFIGSLTFSTDIAGGLASVTLRQSPNYRGEEIISTLPLVDLEAPSSKQDLVLPHIGAGPGLRTQLILINASNGAVSGSIRFSSSSGQPLQLESDGLSSSQFPFELQGAGVALKEFSSAITETQAGYAVVSLDQGDATPSGSTLFQFRNAQGLISEAGVAGSLQATTHARIFVDNARTQTGIALAAPGNPAATVEFILLDRFGRELAKTARSLPDSGHLSIFAHELFSLQEGFSGVMEIKCDEPIFPVTLKLTNNQRGDPILTTLPVADLNRPPEGTRLIFPQIGSGDGFATRLILIDSVSAQPAQGRVEFLQSDGSPMILPLGSERGASFGFSLNRGGTADFRPGNEDPVAKIVIGQQEEIVLNAGNHHQIHPLVIDSQGSIRDDFRVLFDSEDEEVAQVSDQGVIEGLSGGFSTLTVTAGGLQATATIVVAQLEMAPNDPEAREIRGLVVDRAGRIFLASPSHHVILQAPDLQTEPTVFAGNSNESPNLVDGDRLEEARFNSPSFLAYDHARGDLYVSDTGNDVIRRISPNGVVQLVAGVAGADSHQDGTWTTARFSRPQGLALDNQGFLWIADTDNHVIRRLNLREGRVETIAGSPGLSGTAGGIGAEARFSSPTDISIESDVLIDSLRKEIGSVSVLVADTGNGLIRRILEDGRVETVAASEFGSLALNSPLQESGFLFSEPEGIASDSLGNIYVSEADSSLIRTILPSGRVVVTAEPIPGDLPTGIAAAQGGGIIVASRNLAVRSVQYRPPSITSFEIGESDVGDSPSVENRGGQKVTIVGRNLSADSEVFIDDKIVDVFQSERTSRAHFTAPQLVSGLTTLTIRNRAGLDQNMLLAEPQPLLSLQRGEVTTVVGGRLTFAGDGSPASDAVLARPGQMAVDNQGNLYIADTENHRIRKVEFLTKTISTIAGIGEPGFGSDGIPAPASALDSPSSVALDSSGNLLIADTGNHVIRKVDSSGMLITLIGTGRPGAKLNPRSPLQSHLNGPRGIAVAPDGSIYLADTGNHRVLQWSRDQDGELLGFVAGTGTAGFDGDEKPALQAALHKPCAVTVDRDGRNLYIADTGNHRIRRVDVKTNWIFTLAGDGQAGFAGEGTQAIAARLSFPSSVIVDNLGMIYIADTGNQRVRQIDEKEVITTLTGNGEPGFAGDGEPAIEAEISDPLGVAVDGAGNIYISDSENGRVRLIDAVKKTISTLAGQGPRPPLNDEEPALTAETIPNAVVVDDEGNLFFVEATTHRVRRYNPGDKSVETIAGTGRPGLSGDGGLARQAMLDTPTDLALLGNLLYVADSGNHQIRVIGLQDRRIRTAAGTSQGFSGDGTPALNSQLDTPQGVAVDDEGWVYVADTGNRRVRRFELGGLIETYAGGGGDASDDVAALEASLEEVLRVELDGSGNVFISEPARIRKIDALTRRVTSVAGNGQSGDSGDGAVAQEATVIPLGLALDNFGNLLFAQKSHHRIRLVDLEEQTIKAVVGDGIPGLGGDNQQASRASLKSPSGLAVDGDGNLYIADTGNKRIRAVADFLSPTNFEPEVLGFSASPTIASPGTPVTLTGLARDRDSDDLTFLFFAGTSASTLETIIAARQASGCMDGCNQSASFSLVRFGPVFFSLVVSDGNNFQQGNQVSVLAGPDDLPSKTCRCGDTVVSVDAGPDRSTLVGGSSLNLQGAATFTPPGIGSFHWSILDDAGLGSALRIEDEGQLMTRLTTSPVSRNAGIVIELEAAISDCSCSDLMTVTLSTEADLSLKVTGPGVPVIKDTAVEYLLDVFNQGPSAATNVTLQDTLPEGFTPLSATPSQGSCSLDSTVVCELGGFPSGSAARVLIRALAQRSGRLTNLASVGQDQFDPDLSNNSSSVMTHVLEGASADLSISKTFAPEEIRQGQELAYFIKVANNGPDDADEVTIIDDLPAGIFALTASQACSLNIGGFVRKAICSIENLKAGQETEVWIRGVTAVLGPLPNTASVAAVQVDPNPADNSETIVADVLPAPFPSVAPQSLLIEDTFLRVAVMNRFEGQNQILIDGLSAGGQSVGSTESNVIPPRGQSTFLADDLLPGAASLSVRGLEDPIQSLLLVGDSTTGGGERLDMIGGLLPDQARLFLTQASQAAAADTLLYLFNPDLEETATINLQLRDRIGEVIGQVDRVLAPSGSLQEFSNDLFGAAPPLDGGYVRIESSHPIRGFGLVSQQESLSFVAALGGTQARKLFAPHFFLSDSTSVRLRLLNTGTSQTRVTVKAFDDQRDPLDEASFEIAPDELKESDLATLLGIDRQQLSPLESLGGFLELELEGGDGGEGLPSTVGIVGMLSLESQSSGFLSNGILSAAGMTESVFPHLVHSRNNSPFFLGLAILNPSSEPVLVDVEAFNELGQLSAQTSVPLGPQNRFVGLLSSSFLFGASFEQTGGHLRVVSDVPVIVQAILGGANSLAVMEPQPPLR